jgi:hypothetical protein
MSLGYFYLIYSQSRDLASAALITFITHLPFANGKNIQLFLLPKEFVSMIIKRNLFFYFPLPISDFYLGIFIWMMTRNKLYQSIKLPFGIILSGTGFIIVGLLSLVLSKNIIVSGLSLILLIKLFLIFLIPSIYKNNLNFKGIVIYIMAAFVVFDGFLGLLQFLMNGNFGRYIEMSSTTYAYGKITWENSNLLRISGTFADPDLFGTYMFMNLMLFMYLLIKRKFAPEIEKNIYRLCILISGISVFVTGNRMLYLILILAVIMLLIFCKSINNIILILLQMKTYLMLLPVFLILFPYVALRMQNLPAVFANGPGSFRFQMIDYSNRLGLSNFFGVGLGMAPYSYAVDFPRDKLLFGPDPPHNIFSQVLAETGIVGFVIFILFLYFSFRPFLIRTSDSNNIPFFIAAIIYIVSACFYPLFIPLTELPAIFFLYLGLAVNQDK